MHMGEGEKARKEQLRTLQTLAEEVVDVQRQVLSRARVFVHAPFERLLLRHLEVLRLLEGFANEDVVPPDRHNFPTRS